MFFFGLDLNFNSGICEPALTFVAGIADEPGQTCLRAAYPTFGADDLSPLCGQVRRRAQDQEFLVPRSISVHGLRAADVSRKPARHRSLPAGSHCAALSPGHS